MFLCCVPCCVLVYTNIDVSVHTALWRVCTCVGDSLRVSDATLVTHVYNLSTIRKKFETSISFMFFASNNHSLIPREKRFM